MGTLCNAQYTENMFLKEIFINCNALFMPKVLTSTFNDENCDSVNLGPADSYIKHSVAPGRIRPSTAPTRLEVRDAPSDISHSTLGAGEPMRPQRDLPADTRPALKRKVLR